MKLQSASFAIRSCAVVMALASIVRAAALPIANPRFEELSRALAVGEQTNGAGGVGVPVATRFPFNFTEPDWTNPVEVPGWRTRLLPPGSTAIVRAGVLNPPLIGGEAFISGQDGGNVFAIQNAQVGQTLEAQLQPNTRYRLSFLGGIGRFDSDYFLAVSLIAVDGLNTLPLENEPGVTRLAITQGLIPPMDTFGTLLPYSLEYTTPPVLPSGLANKYVGIHIWGSDGIPRIVYDDFHLDATVVPEPTMLGLLMVVGAGALHRRRRRRE
ncbi:MAG: PEP-CTERM sorting domain-containing protein [Phycisphaerales bacterium]|nr:PEP-CTERM sorting domain-containing protein [Phycisphaerales bacterium]MCB9856484.1 PEP-CTERM sorting domain-containing protein [Phycisphaerales bacterium]MCB9863965.1 PEP-CTERM sorting domain-containing protein [Phycisphaerales bacterium]